MLARLGFSDPDKKNPLHDLACQYVAAPDVAQRLCRQFDLDTSKREQVSVEVPLSKGSGQYKTTIGFLDVLIPAVSFSMTTEQGVRYEPVPPEEVEERRALGIEVYEESAIVVVEVKTGFTNLGDVLRQIKMYREYLNHYGPTVWLLVTTFEMNEADVGALGAEGIGHVMLGQSFRDWTKSRGTSPVAKSFTL